MKEAKAVFEEWLNTQKAERDEQLKQIKLFGFIRVYLQGDAEDAGLTEKDLTEYAILRFKNNSAGMEYQKEPFDQFLAKMQEGKEVDIPSYHEIGWLTFRVWLVGDDYPIAYYVSSEAGSFAALPNQTRGLWYFDFLGCGPKEKMPAIIRECIDNSIERCAIAFLQARGEM